MRLLRPRGCRCAGLAIPLLASLHAATAAAGPPRVGGLLPSRVAEFLPGTGAGFGQAEYPGNVLSGPDGGIEPPFLPQDQPTEVLALGNGGSITLAWDGDAIIDGPGPDFTVFENVLLTRVTLVPFIEAGVVQVGQRLDQMVTIPFRFVPPSGWDALNPYAIPFAASNYEGLAGTLPTLATPTNGIDPADPATSGGNAFDLAGTGLTWVRYVRIIDPGQPTANGALQGSNGLPIYDTPLSPNGFDLDTVLAINHGPRPDAASAANWAAYE